MDRPRRIAILIDSLLAGGAERVVVQVASALDRDQFAAHVLVGRHSGPLEDILRADGIPFSILGRRRRFGPRGYGRALAVVRSADLLHAHKFVGSVSGVALARAARRPLIAHEHTFRGERSLGRTLAYRYWIAPAARRILCVSSSVAGALAAEGVPADKLRVVPNGVPLDIAVDRASARAELQLDPEASVVGIVGRLREEKRHDLALHAVARLREQGTNVTLCAVGDGPRRGELEQLAVRLGISGSVRWAGERPNAGRLMRAFDVTLLCSTFEGMPLAALESLVAGVPVVATAVGGLPELLGAGAGELVPIATPAALAQGLASVLEEEREQMSARQRAFDEIRARHGLQHVAREYEQVYREVLRET
jgi:glycosyltransferase involved in cell wall biosynthesis